MNKIESPLFNLQNLENQPPHEDSLNSKKRSFDEVSEKVNNTFSASFKKPNLSLLITEESSILSPQLYGEKARVIQSTKELITGDGKVCKIMNMLSEEGKPAKGAFSEVYIPEFNSPQVCPGIPNDEIVIKILKGNQLYDAKNKIDISLGQYDFLIDFFKKEENPPIVTIHNREDVEGCGYTVVEKVIPFAKAPWSATTLFSKFSAEQKKCFDAVVRLIEASNCLKKAGMPKLDLKWNNLGKNKNGDLVLLDYVNIPFTFSHTKDSYAKRLAANNPHIQAWFKSGIKWVTLFSKRCEETCPLLD